MSTSIKQMQQSVFEVVSFGKCHVRQQECSTWNADKYYKRIHNAFVPTSITPSTKYVQLWVCTSTYRNCINSRPFIIWFQCNRQSIWVKLGCVYIPQTGCDAIRWMRGWSTGRRCLGVSYIIMHICSMQCSAENHYFTLSFDKIWAFLCIFQSVLVWSKE